MTKFDVILWRVIGILLLFGSLLLASTAAWTLYRTFYSAVERRVAAVIQVNEETQREEGLQLGAFNRLAGWEHYVAPLYARPLGADRPSKSHGAYSGWPVRNYLFYHPDDATSHWVFDSHASSILNLNQLLSDPAEKEMSTVTGLVFTRASLQMDDHKQSIWTSGPYGQNVKVLLEDVDHVLRVIQHDADRWLVLYFKEGRYFVLQANAELDMVSTQELTF